MPSSKCGQTYRLHLVEQRPYSPPSQPLGKTRQSKPTAPAHPPGSRQNPQSPYRKQGGFAYDACVDDHHPEVAESGCPSRSRSRSRRILQNRTFTRATGEPFLLRLLYVGLPVGDALGTVTGGDGDNLALHTKVKEPHAQLLYFQRDRAVASTGFRHTCCDSTTA